MIHRRTMREEPHVAPDGTLCYFLSSTTIADFDWFGVVDHLDDFGDDEAGLGYPTPTRVQLVATDSGPDDLILWPTDDEVARWVASCGAPTDLRIAAGMRGLGFSVAWDER